MSNVDFEPGPSAVPDPLLTAARVALARWGGRTVGGVDLPTVMVAIAGAESGWRADAAGDEGYGDSRYRYNGYASWGLWQINMAAHYDMLAQQTGSQDPAAWAQWLSDPAKNASAADIVIGSSARNLDVHALHPWTTWFNSGGDGQGTYLQHMDMARQAIAAASGGAVEVPPPGASQGNYPLTVTNIPVRTIVAGGLIAAGAIGAIILGAEILASSRRK